MKREKKNSAMSDNPKLDPNRPQIRRGDRINGFLAIIL